MADEKRFVYQVELDIKKVASQVEQLRKLLAEIFESSAGAASKADPVERMAGELKEVARARLDQEYRRIAARAAAGRERRPAPKRPARAHEPKRRFCRRRKERQIQCAI